MDKRGLEPLLTNIIYIALIFMAASALFIWINGVSGKASYAETAAKQVALVIDSSLPGTSLIIKPIPEVSVRVAENKVLGEYEKSAFAYGFSNKNKLNVEKEAWEIKIEVENE